MYGNKKRKNMKIKKLKGLYGINDFSFESQQNEFSIQNKVSDFSILKRNTIFMQLELAIKGGLSIFQLRNKNLNDVKLLKLSFDLDRFCKSKNVQFILNDRVDLAIKFELSGVHLGKNDFDYKDLKTIREHFKGIIGISCYNDLDAAFKAQEYGANYVAFGAFFESKTKKDATRCDIDIIERAKQKLKIPICAIGGINKDNKNMVAKADMIAVINALWNGDIYKNALELSKLNN